MDKCVQVFVDLLENKKTNKKKKTLWNNKVMVMPIIVGSLGTIFQDLEKILKELEIRGKIETIQTTGLLRSARILRRVLET